MRSQSNPKPALIRYATAVLACLLAVPANAAELQWIQHRAEEVAPEPSAVRTVAFTAPATPAKAAPRRVAKQPTAANQTRTAAPAKRVAAVSKAPQRVAKQPTVQRPASKPAAATTSQDGEVVFASALAAAEAEQGAIQQVCHEGGCHCGGCVLPEPGCAVIEPGCGCVEPGCACEPGCAVVDPGCAVIEPGCGCGDAACGDCCSTIGASCFPGRRICICLPPVNNLVFFAGVQGFKNPLDGFRDRGNFGFNEGFNLGGRLPWLPFKGVGYQFGYRATHNQLNGTEFDAAAGLGAGTADSHTQSFVTAGFFRRCQSGWQYGVVYDHLNDERIESVGFNQVRGQISITNPKGGEIGFMFASATNEEFINLTPGVAATNQLFAASDQYLAFYRFRACGGGEFRVMAGGDSDSRGILGADMLAPLNHSWSINTGFRYFTAEESAAGVGSQQEAWNLGIDLVYHFRGTGKKWHNDPYRPLFNVADNGSLSVARVDN